MSKSVLIVSSFWGDEKHVGNYRIERFINWFKKLGYETTVINSGSQSKFQVFDWGNLITVKNPLSKNRKRVYNRLKNKSLLSLFRSILSKLVYFWVFIPDSNIIWALLVSNNKIVKKYVDKKIDFIISSSPPESNHIAALILSKKINAKLIVDLRDGWLDEPLNPYLKKYAIRRLMERIPEYFVYKYAATIFITSKEWETILRDRNPDLVKRTMVLTNAYPVKKNFINRTLIKNDIPDSICLLHSGRFRLSSGSRHLPILFDPIILASNNFESNIKITLRGEFSSDDLKDLEAIREKCDKKKIEILNLEFIDRISLFSEIESMDGLLLLSTSKYAVPSKLFEYIPTGKPLLVMCPKESAVWNICNSLQQAFLYDYTLSNENQMINVNVIYEFFIACKLKNYEVSIPKEFSEDNLYSKFKMELMEI